MLENKIEKFNFLKGEPYLCPKKKTRSPGDEPAMVLRYVLDTNLLALFALIARFISKAKWFGWKKKEKNQKKWAIQDPL